MVLQFPKLMFPCPDQVLVLSDANIAECATTL